FLMFLVQVDIASSLLICLGYGNQLINLSRKMLENDPSDQRPIREIVLTHIYSGKYQDALIEIARVVDHSDQPQLYVYKLYCMLQFGATR
ncbi:MAG: hypothetical protein U5K54_20780, partial [Cytophagales bacterium]|nr:hypothetical protein [Cytophagales bacterium]